MRPQKESGASFDKGKAFLLFLPRCLPVPTMGMLQGGVSFIRGDVSEEEDHDFTSLCQIALKIW